MAVANYCDSNRKRRCLLCRTVPYGDIIAGLYGRPYGCASPYKHPDRVLCGRATPGKCNLKGNLKPSSMSRRSTIFKWNTIQLKGSRESPFSTA